MITAMENPLYRLNMNNANKSQKLLYYTTLHMYIFKGMCFFCVCGSLAARWRRPLTSKAALATSHFSARPEMVMMSHFLGMNSASGLISPFSFD